MPKITYIEHDGSQHTVDAEIGSTVMETALRNDIASIVAECGGSCTCSTCLVHVDEKWFAVVGPPSAEEEEQLDAAFEVKPTSRLSCQIKVTDAARRADGAHAGLSGAVTHPPPVNPGRERSSRTRDPDARSGLGSGLRVRAHARRRRA